MKLSYKGQASRAEFPLTAAFAKKSTNVSVAMTGLARVIPDVKAHVAIGGAFYECDPKTQTELCLPIIEPRGVLGVVGAEHTSAGHFTPERQAWLAALALEFPAVLPHGGIVAPTS